MLLTVIKSLCPKFTTQKYIFFKQRQNFLNFYFRQVIFWNVIQKIGLNFGNVILKISMNFGNIIQKIGMNFWIRENSCIFAFEITNTPKWKNSRK